MGHQAPQVLGQRVPQDHLDLQGHPVLLGQVQLVPLVQVGHQVLVDPLDHQARPAQVLQARQVLRDLQALVGRQAQEQRVQLVHLGHLARLDLQGQELRERQVQVVQVDLQARLDLRDLQDLLDLQDRLAHQGLVVLYTPGKVHGQPQLDTQSTTALRMMEVGTYVSKITHPALIMTNLE